MRIQRIVWLFLGFYGGLFAQLPERTLNEQLQLAVEATQQGSFDMAAKAWQDLEASYGSEPLYQSERVRRTVWFWRAQVALEVGEPEPAIIDLQRWLQAYGNSHPARWQAEMLLARAWAENNQPDEAVAHWKRLMTIASAEVQSEASLALFQHYLIAQNFSEAEALWQTQAANWQQPEAMAWLASLGAELVRNRRPANALKVYRAINWQQWAAHELPLLAEHLRYISAAAYQTGDLDLASGILGHLVAHPSAPPDAQVKSLEGLRAMANRGGFADGLSLVWLGKLYLEANEPVEALAHFEEAYLIYPDSPNAITIPAYLGAAAALAALNDPAGVRRTRARLEAKGGEIGPRHAWRYPSLFPAAPLTALTPEQQSLRWSIELSSGSHFIAHITGIEPERLRIRRRVEGGGEVEQTMAVELIARIHALANAEVAPGAQLQLRRPLQAWLSEDSRADASLVVEMIARQQPWEALAYARSAAAALTGVERARYAHAVLLALIEQNETEASAAWAEEWLQSQPLIPASPLGWQAQHQLHQAAHPRLPQRAAALLDFFFPVSKNPPE